MRLIAIKNLRANACRYPDAKKAVETWYLVVKNAAWSNLEDVREVYRDAESVGNRLSRLPGDKHCLFE